ncbi:MAG: DUF2752 domain-containing protein [Lachnospiraceae bacterium]|nr:DUF2752 domain-containing protein [Lachnospiraceae bacterium]
MKEYIKAVLGRLAADGKEYGIAVVALFIYTVVTNLIFHAFCPLIIFCGIPCPGCGISRATAYFLTGRWQQAWQMNPMIFPIVAAAVYFGWNRYLLGRKARGIKVIIIVLAVLLVAVYAVRMYLYFPNRVPYVYTENNMLAHLYLFWRQMLHQVVG